MHLIQQIQIETTTACQAKCLMCPRSYQTRGHGVMDSYTFWSVADQAYRLGVEVITPFISGEPLTDRRMCEFVEGIADKYRGIEVGFYTNAGLLADDVARRLLSSGNIRNFNVSMQGGTKEVYEKVTGLNWETTVSNVKNLIRINRELGGKVEIRLNMCVFDATQSTVNQFVKMWEGQASVCLGELSNFSGAISVHRRDGKNPHSDRIKCQRALSHLYVYWNGDVGQCCFDAIDNITYGNVHDSTLAEIINTSKFQDMLESHRKLDVDKMPSCCQKCTACNFRG